MRPSWPVIKSWRAVSGGCAQEAVAQHLAPVFEDGKWAARRAKVSLITGADVRSDGQRCSQLSTLA